MSSTARRLLPYAAGALATAGAVVAFRKSEERPEKIVIIGAGSAGIGMIGFLSRCGIKNITVIEPQEVHYYQPYWTLVGAGQKTKQQSSHPMSEMIPNHVQWVKEPATSFQPESNTVTVRSGHKVTYDYLVVAPGIQINWDKIPGVKDSVGKPDSGVVSIYHPDYAEATWKAISNFTGTRAFFTLPATPVKCGGAPQKIMWLFEDHMRRTGKRDGIDIRFWSPQAAIFHVKRYADMLEAMRPTRGIAFESKKELVLVDSDTKTATFKDVDTGSLQHEKYDLLHVTPPMSPPDFIRASPLADAAGWVDVDKHTLRHKKYANVFALGDCTNAPTSKTAAAITGQAPVVVHNIQRAIEKKPLDGKYNGYTSCPLIYKYGKVILAEFGYDGKILESFNPETGKFPMTLMGHHGSFQHTVFWRFKEIGFPSVYWYLWPHGLWYGTNGPIKPDVTKIQV